VAKGEKEEVRELGDLREVRIELGELGEEEVREERPRPREESPRVTKQISAQMFEKRI
tara:strand:- start:163 stop:336 length:174 start_codon:yes stop_codon:yes gene_type:complete